MLFSKLLKKLEQCLPPKKLKKYVLYMSLKFDFSILNGSAL
jgi:hypothetical protein